MNGKLESRNSNKTLTFPFTSWTNWNGLRPSMRNWQNWTASYSTNWTRRTSTTWLRASRKRRWSKRRFALSTQCTTCASKPPKSRLATWKNSTRSSWTARTCLAPKSLWTIWSAWRSEWIIRTPQSRLWLKILCWATQPSRGGSSLKSPSCGARKTSSSGNMRRTLSKFWSRGRKWQSRKGWKRSG